MIDERFVLLGAALSLIGSARYAWSTLQGRTQPNRVTWFLWALAPFVGFAAQVDEGVGWPSILTLSIGVGPAIIFASSFVNPAAYWRVSRFDLACGGVSVVALGVWLGWGEAVLAVLIAVLADLVAGVPTIRKTWSYPHTENTAVFILGAANGAITLLTIDRWDPEAWAFPAYILVIGSLLTAIGVLRKSHVPVVAA